MLDPVSLDDGWVCGYAVDPPVLKFDKPVTSLAEWSFDAESPENNVVAWLKRSFTLEMVDFCVNYVLHLDSAPANTVIFINGERAGVYLSPLPAYSPLALDITMLVALDDNEIIFHVDRAAPGNFADVRLQAVPCD